MSNTERTASIATVSRLPLERPNTIQQAMNDYDLMSAELANTKAQLAEYVDISHRTTAENEAVKRQMAAQSEFFTQQIDHLTNQCDRLAGVLKGITTRYKIIRECFAQCEADAIAEGVNLNGVASHRADGATNEQIMALTDLALHDGSRRTRLAQNSL